MRLVARACLVTAGVLAVASCGARSPLDTPGPNDATAPPPDTWTSGKRLRARLLDAGGGARSFLGFFDAELGVNCDFAKAEDGVWRCVPSVPSSIRYADAACSIPILLDPRGPGSCAPTELPMYANEVGIQIPPVCEITAPQYKLVTTWSRGEQLPAAPIFERLYDGGCALSDNPDGRATYTLVHVAASEFVAADEGIESHGAIGARVLVSSDGARQVLAARDAKRDADCIRRGALRGPNGDDTLCIPATVGVEISFANASCTEPAVVADSRCAKPPVALGFPRSDCDGAPVALHAVGAPYPPQTPIFSKQPQGCAPDAFGPIYTAFVFGETVPDDQYPSLRAATAGSGRITLPTWTAEDGAVVSTGAFRDDAFDGAVCVILRDRCVAIVIARDANDLYRYFADRACTREIVDTGSCDAGPGVLARSSSDFVCGAVPPLFALGDRYSGPVYTTALGGCSTPLDQGRTTWRALGAQVALEDFPRVETIVE
jgi:hypothetical protein